MDPAVQLVQAYLHVNGYFTAVEYPFVQATGDGGTRTVTDIDVLAFRFPAVGQPVGSEASPAFGPTSSWVDPALGCAAEEADMIVAEVKQGRARVNPAMRDPAVLEAALARFGCCTPGPHAERTVRRLLSRGAARTSTGHRIRLCAFGSGVSVPHAHTVTLDAVVDYLDRYLATHWTTIGRAQLSQPALAMLSVLRKARLQSSGEKR